MSITQPRKSHRRGGQILPCYSDRDIRLQLEAEHKGKFVAIDIETGQYEIDADERAASNRLLARIPSAQIWLKRIGFRHVRHFGARPQAERP